jgi:hypothetical protein
MKRSNRYRLPPAEFARLYPKRPTTDNEFSAPWKLLNGDLSRTPNCIVRFDPEKKAHRYKIRLHWLGDGENTKTGRDAWAWSDELEKIASGEN